MIQAFVITFREGLEAFLVVAISISFLRKTGRTHLLPPLYWGVGASLVTSAAAGYLFSLASNQALYEGLLAITAAVLVGTLVIHMWRASRRLKQQIERRLETAAAGTARSGWIAVFLFTILMITREGMETALLLGTLVFQMQAYGIVAGAILGVLGASGIALVWARHGHRVDLRRFLQVTAVFLIVFAVQLLVYGVHELSEAGILAGSGIIHDATEPYGPDGIYGRWLSASLVLLPLGWLLISWFKDGAARRGDARFDKVAASNP